MYNHITYIIVFYDNLFRGVVLLLFYGWAKLNLWYILQLSKLRWIKEPAEKAPSDRVASYPIPSIPELCCTSWNIETLETSVRVNEWESWSTEGFRTSWASCFQQGHIPSTRGCLCRDFFSLLNKFQRPLYSLWVRYCVTKKSLQLLRWIKCPSIGYIEMASEFKNFALGLLEVIIKTKYIVVLF